MDRLLQRFRQIWVWDSEFVIVPGWHVTPVCMAGVEVRSGASVTATFDHAGQQIANPLPFGPDVLHVLFSATADLGFALAAGWGLPYNVLDLWAERRNFTNNMTDGQGNPLPTDLVSTCHAYGIFDTISFEEKEANRTRIAQGFPFTPDEMSHVVEYCRGDVKMTRTLLDRLVGQIGDIDEALHRGRCMKAVTCMEWNGVPVAVAKLDQLKKNTKLVRRSVVHSFEDEFRAGIHNWDKKGDPHFSNKGYTSWVRGMGFDEENWLFNGEFASADDKYVLKPMSSLYAETLPVIEQYRQLRKFLTLAKSEFKFSVGPDGRNRSSLRPFKARSSRSQPETSENIPNATKALRSLLSPHEGKVLLHRDATPSCSACAGTWRSRPAPTMASKSTMISLPVTHAELWNRSQTSKASLSPAGLRCFDNGVMHRPLHYGFIWGRRMRLCCNTRPGAERTVIPQRAERILTRRGCCPRGEIPSSGF